MGYIVKNGNKFSFRIRVPTDLVEHFGKDMIKEPLGIADRQKAQAEASRRHARYQEQFEAIRNGQRLGDVNERLDPFSFDVSPGEDAGWLIARAARNEQAKAEMIQKYGPLVIVICRMAGIRLDAEDIAKLVGARETFVAAAESLKEIGADAAPDYRETQPDVSAVSGVPTLRGIFNEWVEKRKPAPSSVRECKFTVDRFEELHGVLPVTAINDDHVRLFIEAIERFPVNINNADAALPLPEILKKYEGVECRRSSPASVEKRFGFLRALLKRAVNRKIIAASPTAGFKIDDTDKAVVTVVSFKPADLTAIFTSPAYVRLSKERGPKFWLPLVGLYSGARMGEILQLQPSDVRRAEGGEGWVMDINREGGKRVKNDSSIRPVPVHPELERLGFVDWALSQGGPLFDDLISKREGYDLSHDASKWFRHLRVGAGVVEEGRRFHSFRHLAKDRARAAGIDEEFRDRLLGHENGSVGRGYGEVTDAQLEQAMRRLTWPVDLSHLLPTA